MALCSQIHHYRRAVFLVSPPHRLTHDETGDAAVGKSSLLVRLTDQRFLANPDPTVRCVYLVYVSSRSSHVLLWFQS